MKKTVTVIALTLALLTPAISHASGMVELSRIEKSVVKVYSSYRRPNLFMPWQYKGRQSGIGSGVVIEGKRILTNAHVVQNAVFIEVRMANDPQKYRAVVEAVGHHCDLALLRLEDESFFKQARPLKLGRLPELLDRVSAYGFPRGGSEISITQGVVSRIELTRYVHSGYRALGVQIDAAINPGNSGGPVIKKGNIVGIAMQGLRNGDNIGYIIPTPVIRHFLDDIKDGAYDGFPDDGLVVQLAENRALRAFHAMHPHQTGVIVTKVIPGSSSDGLLQQGDVITAIDGRSIANDASVRLNKSLRVAADFLIQSRQVGESVTLSIIRKGETKQIVMTLQKPVRLVERLFDRRPSYMIYGGLIFTPLTLDYLRGWGRSYGQSAPRKLVHLAQDEYPSADRQQVVVLSGVLTHAINQGYHSVAHREVIGVNGHSISSLADLKKKIDEGEGAFVVVQLEGGHEVVMNRKEVKEAELNILSTYGVSNPLSADLRR